MLFKNLFRKKSKVMDEKTLNSIGIKTAKVERIEVDKVESNPQAFKLRVLYTDTTEEEVVDINDFESYDKIFDSGRPVKILGTVK